VTVVNDAANTTGIFSENISGLAAATSYSFAAYATNTAGTTYTSPNSTFTTAAANASVLSLSLASPTPSNGATVIWTLTFNSAVTGLTASNFSLSGTASGGATVGTPTTGNGGVTWAVPVTTGASDGGLTLSLANSAGLAPTITTALPFAGAACTMDKTLPTVTVTPSSGLTNVSPITFTLSFSESVSGLTVAKINVANGTKGTLSGSGNTYTLPVTPTSTQTTVTCQVTAAAASDAATNTNPASNTASVTYDAVAPTVIVSTSASSPTNLASIPITLTYSESVTGVALGDLTVTNGTPGGLSGSGASYTLSITPTGQGTMGCMVNANTALDLANNNNTASNNLSIVFDNVAPVVSSVGTSMGNGSYPAGTLIPLTVAFNEAVNVTGAPTLALNSGGSAVYASGSGTSTLTFNYTVGAGQNSPGLDYTSTSALLVAGGSIADLAGNVSTLALPAPGSASSLGGAKAIVVDTNPPTVVVTPSGTVTNSAPINFTLTFSESVSGLGSAGITVTNGAKGTLTGSGTTYTLPVTPSADGAVTCRVNAAAAQDPASNGNTVSTTASVNFDTTPPTVANISSLNPEGALKAGASITLTVRFSESVSVSGTPTLSLNSGGTASYTAGSGSNTLLFVYTVGAGQNTPHLDALSLSGGSMVDSAGNAADLTMPGGTGTLAFNKVFVVDTIAPTVTVTPDATRERDTPILFTFSFSETVTSLTTGGITVTNGAKGTLSGSGGTYTLPVTPTAQGPVTCRVDANAAFDVAANPNTASATASVIFDNVPPELPVVSAVSSNPFPTRAKLGDVITVGFTASEPLVQPLVTIAGRAAVVTGSDTTWTASITTGAGDAEGAAPFSISYADLAGNQGVAVQSTTDQSLVIIDRTPPNLSVVSIVSSNANPLFAKGGDSVVVSLTANEPLQTPVVSILGQPATVAPAPPPQNQTVPVGTRWTATAIIAPESTQGPVAFALSYSDLAGNAGAAVSATTDATGVTIDTVTQPPTLTAPASGLLTKSPIAIDFTLPETALPGSVKLTFSKGGVDRELVLAGSQETATQHPFTLDPAAAGTSPFVISGAAIPDDTYSVSISYLDMLGNTRAAAGATAVAIDTTPPALNLANQRVPASATGFAAVPDLSSIATDLHGVTTFTQTPTAGAVHGLGRHTINVSATDAAGNPASGMLSLTVAFDRPTAPAVPLVRGYTGQAAPGAGDVNGPPAGTTITGFGTPAISDYRDLVSLVSMKAGSTPLKGIYKENATGAAELIAFQKMAAPGFGSGVLFQIFREPVTSPGGAVAFTATLKGTGVTAGNDDGLWTDLFGDTLTQVLREGAGVPGLTNGEKLKSITSVSLHDSELLVSVALLPGAGGVARNVNDSALIRLTGATAGELVLRKGDPYGGSKITSISVLQPAPGSNGQGRWHAEQKTVAKIGLQNHTSELVTIAPAAAPVSLLASGSVWSALGLPAIDSAGSNVAITGTLALGSSVTKTSDTALALSSGGGAFQVFEQENGPAPVGAEPAGPLWASFLSPVVNDSGAVLFQATLKGAGVTAATRNGLWWGAGNLPGLLARQGEPAVGEDGLPLAGPLWSQFTSYALPGGENAGPVFIAKLNGPTVKPTNNLGLWAVDSNGKLRLLLRTQDDLVVGPKTLKITNLRLLNALPGSFGVARSYNETGSVAVQVFLSDRSQALVRIDVP
jgi:hypothetical protein